MIHALGYEPQDQRQGFEPREQQERDRHIHLHFHLDLTFRARRERSTHPNIISLRRIFVALLATTVMPLLILPLAMIPPDGPPPTALENLMLLSSGVSVAVGLVLAWCGIGLLFWVWRTSPIGHLGQGLRLAMRAIARECMGLSLLLIPIAAGCFLFFFTHGFVPSDLLMLVAVPYLLMFFTNPLIIALLLMWVSREARTIHQQSPTHNKLGFVVVGGMVLILLGGMLFNIQAMLGGGISPLIYLSVICIAVIVAIRALFGPFRSRNNRQASPKDASPFDIGSHQGL